MGWRKHIKIHPACDLFPAMSGDDLKALGADIKAHRLRHPVVFWQDGHKGEPLLIDGRSRLDAMELAGIRVVERGRFKPGVVGKAFETITSFKGRPDPFELVIGYNLHRRHLTPEQRREIVAKILKAQPEKSNRQIAKLTRADDKTVGKVRAKLEAGAEIPHLENRVDARGIKQPAAKPKRIEAGHIETEVPNQEDREPLRRFHEGDAEFRARHAAWKARHPKPPPRIDAFVSELTKKIDHTASDDKLGKQLLAVAIHRNAIRGDFIRAGLVRALRDLATRIGTFADEIENPEADPPPEDAP